MKEFKVIAEFNIDREKQFLAMSIDDFYFHVWAKKDQDSG